MSMGSYCKCVTNTSELIRFTLSGFVRMLRGGAGVVAVRPAVQTYAAAAAAAAVQWDYPPHPPPRAHQVQF